MSDLRIWAQVRKGKVIPSGYVLVRDKKGTKAVHQSEYLPALLRLLEKGRLK